MRYVARLSRLVWALNLGLLAVVVSLVVYAVLPTGSAGPTPAATGAPDEGKGPEARDNARPPAVDPKLILARDIFGVGQMAAAPEASKIQNVPVAPRREPPRDLSLRLLGTVVDDGGASYAVIENATLKSQDVYRVGDAIGDLRVSRIEQNRVVILNAGVLQTLDLALTGPAPALAVAQGPAPTPAAAAAPVASRGDVLRVASATERQVNTRASSESVGQATSLLRKVKLAPHETDGKSDGLTISGLGDSTLAQLAGVQDGDVVQSINGHPVPSQAKASQVLRKARSLGSARVEFQRGQESRTLTFHAGSW
jgi:general secretion pathway protein C